MKKAVKTIPLQKISRLIYIPTFASFLPFIGIPFGISAILWGFSSWNIGGRKAAIIASLGILFTFVFGCFTASQLKNLFQTSPSMIEIKADLSVGKLGHVMRYIEYYKLGHGHYPTTLLELQEEDIPHFNERDTTDPISYQWMSPIGAPEERPFYYAVGEDGQHYALFSTGPDHTPYTQDDLLPVIIEPYRSATGWVRSDP